jgi:hypothetical protein
MISLDVNGQCKTSKSKTSYPVSLLPHSANLIHHAAGNILDNLSSCARCGHDASHAKLSGVSKNGLTSGVFVRDLNLRVIRKQSRLGGADIRTGV